MFIIKDVLQNYLMGNKTIARFARKFHNTGINSDSSKVKKLYADYAAIIDFKNKSILDLGPGQTLDILKLAKKNGAMHCAALDVVNYFENSRNIINQDIDFQIYDGKKFPFDSQTFDVIVSNSTFEHLRHPAEVVEECRRVLKNNGLLITNIDLADHYNLKNDKKIFECLKYSENLWNKMTINRSSYVNRLRYSDWLNLFLLKKFKIRQCRFKENEYIKKNYQSIKYLSEFDIKDACIQNLNCVLIKIE